MNQVNINTLDGTETVGDMLKFWRNLQRMSQMDLALDADISTRHLSFVETGRSKPSRELLLTLSRVLRLPLRHINGLLNAAGYAPEFRETPFFDEQMALIRQALTRILEKHDPYPALVLNRAYRILMTNRGYENILRHFLGADALTRFDNVYRLIFAQNGLRPYIRDWEQIEQFMLSRLWDEAVTTQHAPLFELYNEITVQKSSNQAIEYRAEIHLPMLSMTIEKDGIVARLFSTITTLGTPLDLTTQELRIESLFPADRETELLFDQPRAQN